MTRPLAPCKVGTRTTSLLNAKWKHILRIRNLPTSPRDSRVVNEELWRSRLMRRNSQGALVSTEALCSQASGLYGSHGDLHGDTRAPLWPIWQSPILGIHATWCYQQFESRASSWSWKGRFRCNTLESCYRILQFCIFYRALVYYDAWLNQESSPRSECSPSAL